MTEPLRERIRHYVLDGSDTDLRRLTGTGVATSQEVDALERSLRRAASGADGWLTTPFMLDLTLRKR